MRGGETKLSSNSKITLMSCRRRRIYDATQRFQSLTARNGRHVIAEQEDNAIEDIIVSLLLKVVCHVSFNERSSFLTRWGIIVAYS